MATKKTTKKSYKSGPSKSRSTKPRGRAAKKAGKKGGGPPAEDPIIVGGGSFLLDFDRTFRVGNHPTNAANRQRGTHRTQPNNQITEVVFLTSVDGVATRRIPIEEGETAVAICYTSCTSCPEVARVKRK
jgi:hypothetical protein